MRDFVKIFKEVAESFMGRIPGLKCNWQFNSRGQFWQLIIYKDNCDGFDVLFECKLHGLYVYIDGWTGLGCDEGLWSVEEFRNEIPKLMDALINDYAELTVDYSNKKPYKWELNCNYDNKIEVIKTNSWIYNYFGKKSQKVFRNKFRKETDQDG